MYFVIFLKSNPSFFHISFQQNYSRPKRNIYKVLIRFIRTFDHQIGDYLMYRLTLLLIFTLLCIQPEMVSAETTRNADESDTEKTYYLDEIVAEGIIYHIKEARKQLTSAILAEREAFIKLLQKAKSGTKDWDLDDIIYLVRKRGNENE